MCFGKTLNSLVFHNIQRDLLWTYLLRIDAGHCVSSLRVFAVSVYTNISVLMSWMIWCFPYSTLFTLGHQSLQMLVTAATCAGLNSFFLYSRNTLPNIILNFGFPHFQLCEVHQELQRFWQVNIVRYIRAAFFLIDNRTYLNSTIHNSAVTFEILAYAFRRASSILQN